MADYYLQIILKKECICFKYFFHKRRPIVLSSFKRHSEKVLIYCPPVWIGTQTSKNKTKPLDLSVRKTPSNLLEHSFP